MKNRTYSGLCKSLAIAVVMVLTLPGRMLAQDGEKLFRQNCAVCHKSHEDGMLTGPGLKGVFDRVPKGDWIHRWIMDNQKLIKSGDAYANEIYNKYGKAQMTVFAGTLDDKQVDQIIDFLKSPPPTVAKKDNGGPTGGTEGETSTTSNDPIYMILVVIVVLAILLVTLRSIRVALQTNVSRRTGTETEDATFWDETKSWLSGHKRLFGVICIVVACIGMKSCWDACFNIGVYYDYRTQKGYKPEQPIKFSHKLHAGDNEIACQYCHNSVEKSRHAGIPTVNVCMNCHKGISKGPQYGEREIAKIYQAAGFNTSTQQYEASKQNPIKWIKVHNLPDHVYFNHSQHVVVGKIDCAKCHGDVKSMTTAEQKAPLTMKWCIECHRNTEVAMKGNAYYDRLHKALKEKYAGQRDKKFTVENIGGLECARCHY